MQIEAPDLGGADVDVVGPGQVGGVRRAQEAEAVWQHLQRSLAVDAFALFRLVLQQREDQVLLAHAVGVFDLVGVGHLHELGDVEVFQVGEMHRRGVGKRKRTTEKGKVTTGRRAAPVSAWPAPETAPVRRWIRFARDSVRWRAGPGCQAISAEEVKDFR